MSCPACNGEFKSKRLSRHLSGKSCTACNGVSFTLTDYLVFLTRSASIEDNIDLDTDELIMHDDTKKALLCNCGQLMSKYRITHESDRRIDFCSSCQTVWLDEGEWEYLKVNHLHRRINKLFTEPYQRGLRLEGTRASLDKKYEEQFGAHDYKKLKEVSEWINNNPNKNLLKAYINATDPYSVLK